MRIGLIARDNNRGLGIQSFEFYQHIKPYKTLIIDIDGEGEKKCPERYSGDKVRRVNNNRIDKEIEWFLDGVDLIFTIETFYSNEILKEARKRKIKTCIQGNWEWYSGEKVDLYLAPSLWNYKIIPEPKEYLPCPVNRKVSPFELKKKAKVFFHNAGNGVAAYGRNGTDLVLKAIPLVKSKVKFIIKSQRPLEKINDSRIEWRIKDYKNYWEGVEGDVYLYPRRYGGLSLQLNEAMSRGLVPIMIRTNPVNGFLPKELLIKPRTAKKILIFQWIYRYDISPQDLADKIDEIANKDISKYSEYSNHIAENWSWKRLLPKYLNVFKKLCQN